MKMLKIRSFPWWEVALLKVCLVSFGILLGLYFYEYLLAFLWLWWTLFAVTAAYFLVRLARSE